MKRESVVVLKDCGVWEAADETYGKDANTILKEVMEVSARPEEVRMLFERFYSFLDQEEWEQADRVIEQLEDKLGNNDAE